MISILLATYNGERYIKESIDSILKQSYKDFELLIGFNGTTDSSKEIVNSYSDNRIRIFDYNIDKGKPKTLNKLLNESKYDWIAIQDDDDIWIEDKLEKQIKYIDDYDIIGTQIIYCNSFSEIMGGNPKLELEDDKIKYKTLRGNNQIANSSSITRKQKVLDIGGWDESLEGLEDFDLWMRLMIKNNRFYNLNQELVIHRKHNDSNFNTMSIENHNRIMYNIFKKNGLIC
jgi:O86/O127-antigen biosynthesis beta-1,3-galactosyltransferase